ncbi:hypothetical protein ACWEQ1_34265 [Streptomyces nodosus]
MAVDAIADLLPQEESLALAQRMGSATAAASPWTTTSSAGPVAANMTACQALVLAAIDYAHRTFGCAGLSALIHELTEGHRATFEPPALTALLDRVQAAHRAEHGHAGHSRGSVHQSRQQLFTASGGTVAEPCSMFMRMGSTTARRP